MIKINNKDIIQIAKGRKMIVEVRKGFELIWTAIRSCFGSGYWIDEYPWVDDDVWVD